MFIKIYFIALPVFLAIDMLWLGLIAKNFYAKQLGALMRTDINWIAAAIFYLLFVGGMAAFVISPALARGSLSYAIGYGALFGLIAYATYDLTNLATLKGWPLAVTLVDLAWGAVLSAAVSAITYIVAARFGLK